MWDDLAVLCAIPLTEEEWNRPGEGLPDSDFVRFVSEANFKGNAGFAWTLFKKEAGLIARKLSEFADRGALVKCNATIADLREGVRDHTHVVIIAHWKGPEVLDADIRNPEQIWEVFEHVNCRKPEPPADRAQSAALAAKSLNEFLVARAGSTGGSPAEESDSKSARIMHRDLLNQFPALVQGNRLELWDAMLPAEDVIGLFPPDFSGNVFMLICTSDAIAEIFRRKRPNATCFYSKNTVRVGVALAKLDAALRLMDGKSMPAWRALEVAGEFIDSIPSGDK